LAPRIVLPAVEFYERLICYIHVVLDAKANFV
jgi:hypothetical protein